MTIVEFLEARLAEDEAVSPLNWLIFEVRDGIPGNYAIPDRVKAERAAKRAIVELHASDGGHECPAGREYGETYLGFEANCPTLRALAAIYADQPDYDTRWALIS